MWHVMWTPNKAEAPDKYVTKLNNFVTLYVLPINEKDTRKLLHLFPLTRIVLAVKHTARVSFNQQADK